MPVSKGIACERVAGITSSRVGTPIEERLKLAKSGAGVVDMESYETTGGRNQGRRSDYCLRAVSDPFDQRMPDFNRALKPDGDLDGWKAL